MAEMYLMQFECRWVDSMNPGDDILRAIALPRRTTIRTAVNPDGFVFIDRYSYVKRMPAHAPFFQETTE